MKQVIVFPRGQLTPEDRARLLEHDLIAVEADDPKAVVMHLPCSPLASADDLFMSALAGLTCNSSYNRNDVMVAELTKRLKAKEAKP